MSVFDCVTCGTTVNESVLRCPQCGNDPRVKGELTPEPPPPEPLLCPRCSQPMVRGFVVGRSPGVKFKADLDFLGDLGGITLTEGVLNHSVIAHRCPQCGTVIIPPRSGAVVA